jgi:ferredoxin-thioredoxin reductase catalytic subunit
MDNNSIMLRGLQAPCIQNQDIEQKVGCHLDLFYTYVTKADNELAWSKNSNNEAI